MDYKEALGRVKELEEEVDVLREELEKSRREATHTKEETTDRRKYKRAKVAFAISHRVYLETTGSGSDMRPWEKSEIQDISLGGLLFMTKVQYKENSVIELQLTLPSGYGQILSCASIKRCVKEGDFYNIALEFVNISGYYKGLLEDVLLRQTDRRRSRRYKMGYPFLYTILSTKAKERGYIKNISKHGISFLTSYNLPQNEEIRAEIYISDQIFKVVGKIVYKNESSMYNMYEIGVDFGDVMDEFKDKLEENLRGMFQSK